MSCCDGKSFSIRVKPLSSRFVLVDYDNLAKRYHHDNVYDYVTHVIRCLDVKSDFFVGAMDLESINVCLYGGWYDSRILSRRAQHLQQEISSRFPFVYKTNTCVKVDVQCKLALSLRTRPNDPLLATVVRRDLKQDIEIPYPSCCEDTQAHFDFLQSVVQSGRCPKCGSKLLGDCFIKEGQKLVDAMLFCDGMHLLMSHDTNRVAIVSSDTDLVPVLVVLSDMANGIYHVKTDAEGKESRFSTYYRHLLGVAYHGIEW